MIPNSLHYVLNDTFLYTSGIVFLMLNTICVGGTQQLVIFMRSDIVNVETKNDNVLYENLDEYNFISEHTWLTLLLYYISIFIDLLIFALITNNTLVGLTLIL